MADGTEHLLKDQDMTNRYSASDKQALTSRGEESSPQPPRLNRKALVVFFGVTIVALVIVICTVTISIYSGKLRILVVLILIMAF